MSLTLSHRRYRPRMGALAALAVPLGLLAACVEAPQQSRSEQAQYNACHRIADRVVTQANADALAQNDPISSPYGATSILPNPPNALAIEHQRQDIMDDCLRHIDTQRANVGVVTATPQGGDRQPADHPATGRPCRADGQ